VLGAYLTEGREVLHIPDFITSLEISKFDLGKQSPFSIRSVHVARQGEASTGDCVLDMQSARPAPGACCIAGARHRPLTRLLLLFSVELLSSDLGIQIDAGINDLVAPLLEQFKLRQTDASYIAIRVSDIAFSGTLRLRLSPGVRVAFAGFAAEPRCHLGLELAYHSKLGFERVLPLSALPRVTEILHMVVVKQIAEYALWPRFFAVDLSPPLLLGLNPASRHSSRGPTGRLRVTLYEARGLHELLAPRGDGGAAGSRAAAATTTTTLRAVITTGLEMKTHRWDASGAPLQATRVDASAGTALWGGAEGRGVSLDCDIFSPLGIDFCTLALRCQGAPPLSAQVKVQTMLGGGGVSMYSHASGAADAYGTLPTVVFGVPRAQFDATYTPLLPGRVEAQHLGFSPENDPGALVGWVPLDGCAGAAVRVRLHMDWRYAVPGATLAPASAGCGSPGSSPRGNAACRTGDRLSVAAQAISLFSASLVHSAMVARPIYMHVQCAALRGGALRRRADYTLTLGRSGAWASSAATHPFHATKPFCANALEVLQQPGGEQPVLTLVERRAAGACGALGRPTAVAEALLPISILSPGQAAHWWLDMHPAADLSPARSAAVAGTKVLVIVQLCA